MEVRCSGTIYFWTHTPITLRGDLPAGTAGSERILRMIMLRITYWWCGTFDAKK
jgi:hypothetical protein